MTAASNQHPGSSSDIAGMEAVPSPPPKTDGDGVMLENATDEGAFKTRQPEDTEVTESDRVESSRNKTSSSFEGGDTSAKPQILSFALRKRRCSF